ncbi:hypothetical protein NE237_015652 [Protea cynaroides]|uniref:Uncharacterized protein n=1 Tax=Protea cynaroides TaxID=273540 RepID=A0A9Q0KED0_9MAGN|nr:hypothetical protein NE237_015652 [Protea cynaroides]
MTKLTFLKRSTTCLSVLRLHWAVLSLRRNANGKRGDDLSNQHVSSIRWLESLSSLLLVFHFLLIPVCYNLQPQHRLISLVGYASLNPEAFVDDVVKAYDKLCDKGKSKCLEFLLSNHPIQILHPYTKEWKEKLEEMELGSDAPDDDEDIVGETEVTEWIEEEEEKDDDDDDDDDDDE